MKDLCIVCFLAAARTLNISEAARDLGLTQQSVSKNIRSLEEKVGFPLLHRGSDGVQLTSAGQTYYSVFLEYDRRMYETFLTHRHQTEGDIVFIAWSDWTGCPDGIRRSIARMRKRFPASHFYVTTTEDGLLMDRLRRREDDVALLTRYAAGALPADVRLIPLCPLPMYRVFGREPDAGAAPHIVSFCGERTEEEVAARVRREYERLGLTAGEIAVAPNWASACAQLLFEGGVTFSPRSSLTGDDARFSRTPLDWSVELCAAVREPCGPLVEAFLQSLAEGGDLCE